MFGVDSAAIAYHVRKHRVRGRSLGRKKRYVTGNDAYICSYCQRSLPSAAYGEGKHKHSERPVPYVCKPCSVIRKSEYAYGITKAEAFILNAKTNCDLCGKLQNAFRGGKRRSLFIDHDHKTGAVRGVLCEACNSGLGAVKDNPSTVSSLVQYLERPLPPVTYTDETAGHRQRTYQLPESEYKRIESEQAGVCAGCSTFTPSDRHPTLLIDHCHIRGNVRGLLCYSCNLALGKFSDNPLLLQRAITYIADRENLPPAPTNTSNVPAPWKEVGDTYVYLLEPTQWDIASLELRCGDQSIRALQRIKSELSELGKKVLILYRGEDLLPAIHDMLAYREMQVEVVLHARKCEVLSYNPGEASVFYDLHHLQGGCHSPITYGLALDGKPVAMMSFNHGSVCRGPGTSHLLQRFATVGSVRGAASRLLAAFRRQHPGPVISYSDERYASGNLYEKLGFVCTSAKPKPDYRYWRDGKWYNKSLKQRKHLIAEMNSAGKTVTPEDTEFTMAASLGYLRCYDCGKRTWTLE